MSAIGDADRWLEPAAANLAEAFAGTAERGGFRTARWDDAWAAGPGLPELLFNMVTLLRPITAETAAELTARLDRFFGESDGGPFSVWSAWPALTLAELGYEPIGEAPLMVRPPRGEPEPLPPELQIAEVRTADDLAIFEQTFIDGNPALALQPVRRGSVFAAGALGGPFRFWIGSVDGQPVTVAASCEHAGVIGVHHVATLQEARGRGYGGVITDWAARVNPSLSAVLQSSDLGYSVYERIGFETVAHFTLWMRERQ